MPVARVKRGTTFRAVMVFEADKWAAIYPWTSIEAEVGQGSRRTPLSVAVDAPSRTLTLTATPAQTALWVSPAQASFDVWVTQGTDKVAIPSCANVSFEVIDGITE